MAISNFRVWEGSEGLQKGIKRKKKENLLTGQKMFLTYVLPGTYEGEGASNSAYSGNIIKLRPGNCNSCDSMAECYRLFATEVLYYASLINREVFGYCKDSAKLSVVTTLLTSFLKNS